MAMLFLSLLVFGWRSYQQLPINLMPNISYPSLTVRTEYEGAAPEDVEKLVTRPLEEMLSIVSGLVEISSISTAGLSEIVLEFTWDTDMNIAQQDLRDQLDLFDPPDGVTQKPAILRYDPTLDPVLRIAITPPPDDAPARGPGALNAIRVAAEQHLKGDLEAEAGIAQIMVKGGQEEEIQVLLESDKLKSLGLSPEHIRDSLAARNINLSGGKLEDGRSQYLVRTLNEFTTIKEIAASIITIPNGRQIPLSDVARVFLDAKEKKSIVRIGGVEAVAIDIFKEGDVNTVEVSKRVRDLLGFERELGPFESFKKNVSEGVQKVMRERARQRSEKKRKEAGETAPAGPRYETPAPKRRTLLDRLPEGATLTVISDQARFIEGAIDEVKNAMLIGGLIALAVLFVFLRDLKTTMIIGIAIPISVIAAFIPMFMRGISLNIMSLGGLALGVGMLVDNSIVVLESIFRCREEGDNPVDAAQRGTNEVASAVVASTLTTISVFFPIAFVEGIAGQLFGDLGLTVTFSLLASLLSALYLIPLIASRKPLSLRADQEVIWMLRAYREARRSGGQGRVKSFFSIGPRGLGYLRAHLAGTARESFHTSIELWASGGAPARAQKFGLPRRGLALLLMPLLAALFLCQLTLSFATGALLTGFFLFVIVCLALFLAARLFLRVLLWLPLQLFDRLFNASRAIYGVMLDQSLRFSAILLFAVALLALHAANTARNFGAELIPPMKQGEFSIRMEAPAGARLEQTEVRAQRIENIVRAFPGVESVTVEIGEEDKRGGESRGDNVAEFTVLLEDAEHSAQRQDKIIEELRAAIIGMASEEITFTLPTLFSFKAPIEVQIVGDGLAELRSIGKRARAAVSAVPGVEDAELSMKPGYPEILIAFDRPRLAIMGLSPDAVANRIRTEVRGDVPTRFNSGGERVDIRVRTDKRFLSSKDDLAQLLISDGPGNIRLEDVAAISIVEGPSEIRRIDQRRVILITANIEGRDLGAVSRDIQAAMAQVQMPEDYYFLLGGQRRELETSYQSLYFALALAIFLVYVVMASQFESIWHPALVMFSVPLAFIGVIYALDWYQINLSIMVFLGGIILAGIVVNDAIVLVDYINQLRARGHDQRTAIIEAGKVRLRPILMTTVTTVLALLPMVFSGGEGAEMRRPMAITVMAGLSSATILTLFIIPMLYHLSNRGKRANFAAVPPSPPRDPAP